MGEGFVAIVQHRPAVGNEHPSTGGSSSGLSEFFRSACVEEPSQRSGQRRPVPGTVP